MEIGKFLGLLSLHVLPDRFVRIRHYDILSPCNRDALRSIQQQLDVPLVPKERTKKSDLEIVTSLFVYILRGTSPFFSYVSCHLPFGNHVKTDIFPHNIQITFVADVQR